VTEILHNPSDRPAWSTGALSPSSDAWVRVQSRGMPRRVVIPPELADRPFTAADARAAGLGRGFLGGTRVRRLFRGVYVRADSEPTFTTWIRAALLVLPNDAVVSHSSAMRLRGLAPDGRTALEFSTNSRLVTEHAGIVLHRRGGRLVPETIDGLPVTGPDRTFVDCAHRRPIVEVIQLGDLLVRTGQSTVDRLNVYANTRHLHGVRRARRLLRHVRAGAESPRETVVRLMIVWSGLTEPECNVDIHDAEGRFVARGDLVLRRWLVVVEYDGWYHERDGRQRQRDVLRRERLEAQGWCVVVITARDLRHPESVPSRVHGALVRAGYEGPPPRMSMMWRTWFRPVSEGLGRF